MFEPESKKKKKGINKRILETIRDRFPSPLEIIRCKSLKIKEVKEDLTIVAMMEVV